ncbi:MAG: oxidoreductase [Planctomycetaceae bacterium]|nr:oxidoreductase [Planctomycetaceae bacterium]
METEQTPNVKKKPKLAVFKFASCDGCQLSLLNAEEDLIAIGEAVEISHFLEASSRVTPGPYDLTLVEGSITTPKDQVRIQEIRKQSRYLVTIGACATAGGIQALRNWGDHEEFQRIVYPNPEYLETLATSTAISDHVQVDFELRGCPVNKNQLVELIQDVLQGRKPRFPRHSVCMECKRSGTVCVTVSRGIPCLGPITQAGCGGLCPEYNRGCYGCFGPAAQANASGLSNWLLEHDVSKSELVPLLRNFNADAPAFREEGNRLSNEQDYTDE